MKLKSLFALAGILGLAGCSAETSATFVQPTDASLKSAPGGVATFGFVDLAATFPGLFGAAYPSCCDHVQNGNVLTLTFNGCKSATGGTLAGTCTVTDTPAGSVHNYVVDFGTLVNTFSPAVSWAYTGKMDVAAGSASATLLTEPGCKLTVTDTARPALSKVWTFTADLTAAMAGGGYTLQGTFSFASGATDNVAVTITSPLTWTSAGGYPVSGAFTVRDARTGQTTGTESIIVTFASGTVTINGATLTLGS